MNVKTKIKIVKFLIRPKISNDNKKRICQDVNTLVRQAPRWLFQTQKDRPLFESLGPREIEEANWQAQVVQVAVGGKKCGPYNIKYSEDEHIKMGRYAHQHGAAAAAQYITFRES